MGGIGDGDDVKREMNRLKQRVGLVLGGGTLTVLLDFTVNLLGGRLDGGLLGRGGGLLAGLALGDVLLGLESGDAAGS